MCRGDGLSINHSMTKACVSTAPLFQGKQHAAHVINLYNKVSDLFRSSLIFQLTQPRSGA